MFTSVKFYKRFGGFGITGFHFITPYAVTGRPVGTLGWCTNHGVRSKGQSPDVYKHRAK